MSDLDELVVYVLAGAILGKVILELVFRIPFSAWYVSGLIGAAFGLIYLFAFRKRLRRRR